MKRILIIGSGGSSDRIDEREGDKFYVANSAISRIDFQDVTHVISAGLIYNESELKSMRPQFGQTVETSTKNRLHRASLIYGRKTRKAFVIEGNLLIDDPLERLVFRGYLSDSFTILRRKSIESMVARHLGYSFLLRCWAKDGNLISLIKILSNILFGTHVVHKYKPSTGVICLLIAIDENTMHDEYVLKGINSSSKSYYGSLRLEAPPDHFPFDILAVNKLKLKYNIRQE